MLCEFRGRGCEVRFPFGNAQEMAEHSAKCPDQVFPEGQEPPPEVGKNPALGWARRCFCFEGPRDDAEASGLLGFDKGGPGRLSAQCLQPAALFFWQPDTWTPSPERLWPQGSLCLSTRGMQLHWGPRDSGRDQRFLFIQVPQIFPVRLTYFNSSVDLLGGGQAFFYDRWLHKGGGGGEVNKKPSKPQITGSSGFITRAAYQGALTIPRNITHPPDPSTVSITILQVFVF